MILAAGRGERLRPLTDVVPKPLVPVLNKPLIEYHIERLAKCGVQEIVINHAWLGHKLVEELGNGQRWGIELFYSEEKEALETAGGIKQALPILGDEPFLVINGDIYIDALPDFLSAFETMKQKQALAYLWLVDNPPHHPDGDFSLDQSQVVLAQGESLTFAGMGIYHPKLFENLPLGKCALGPLLKQQIGLQQVMGCHFTPYWCDVGTLERLADVERYLLSQSNK